MALLSLKHLIFPQKDSAECRRLLPDVERQASISLSSTSNSFDDKTSRSQCSSVLRWKVDPRIISDATIGLSDGLTVPFALTAGLSALGTSKLVVLAGFAELAAGALSMGLGGYLGAKGEADGYFAALEEIKDCVANDESRACVMVRSTFKEYSFSAETLDHMTATLLSHPEQMVDFLMRFHNQLTEADFTPSKAYISGLTIASGYFLGGLVPLLPYLVLTHVQDALYCSVIVMAVALFFFGWIKTALVGEYSRWVCFQNAVQMLVLGGVAAAAAMGCVKAIGG